jgi:lactate dehydrogenase-like 2-hydroxyacid dehydrogenase/phosphoserine aminotransferase
MNSVDLFDGFTPTGSPFFGVGPISDGCADEVSARRLRFEFEHWVEKTFRKRGDDGSDLGPFTAAEFARSMHRGEPADSIVTLMLKEIHSYFGFPECIKLAVGLGGGHSGFTATALNLIDATDAQQNIYVDTPRPETETSASSGFFRQSWAIQLVEQMEASKCGDPSRLLFATREGHLPTYIALKESGIKLVFGVGHETTGATTYTEAEVLDVLKWVDDDPHKHHFIIDATSLLGAMTWSQSTIDAVMVKACMFMPLQKAIGGIAGYYVLALTQAALSQIDTNAAKSGFAIPRQFKLAVPSDPRKPFSSKSSTAFGPIFDAKTGKLSGGVINTYALSAFAETAFAVCRNRHLLGDIRTLNRRSSENRDLINAWLSQSEFFEHAVPDKDRRGAAVTLIKVVDSLVTNLDQKNQIVALTKKRLNYDGYTLRNGTKAEGVDIARYINAFPGSPGDFRAWIGGIRDQASVLALLNNIEKAYLEARDDILQRAEHPQEAETSASSAPRLHGRPIKVLICDPVGFISDNAGQVDISEVKQHIESLGGRFFNCNIPDKAHFENDAVYFFYQPHLYTRDDLLKAAGSSQFDALIAAATEIPAECSFALGGVRIGSGVGNMKSASWTSSTAQRPLAPLMNTPSFNSRVTAHNVIKALLCEFPGLNMSELHHLVLSKNFDTGRDLKGFPSQMLEGKRLAILGFGNIGREVARIATTLGLAISVFARNHHREAIESCGYHFSDTPAEAAKGADALSIHVGLGQKLQDQDGFENSGFVAADILDQLKPGAVVLNFDRGEVMDQVALQQALSQGQLRRVYVDADIFLDSDGRQRGPLAPYVKLAATFPEKLVLLPHVAADTDHTSRVAGAIQAVNQIMEAIKHGRVRNLKNALPSGYTDAGSAVLPGIGAVSPQMLTAFAQQNLQVTHIRYVFEDLAALWGAIQAAPAGAKQQRLLQAYRKDIVLRHNQAMAAIDASGLFGSPA